MKPVLLVIGILVYGVSNTAFAQAIRSGGTGWPTMSAISSQSPGNKSSSTQPAAKKPVQDKVKSAELDEEIDDLEGLAQEVKEADDIEQLGETDDIVEGELDASAGDDQNGQSKGTTRKIIRKVVRKRPQATTLVATLPPLPKQRSTLFHFTPILGASYFTVTGDLLKNTFANKIEHSIGLTAGIFMEYRKDRSVFGLESGLYYSQVGAKGAKNVVVVTTQERLNFLFNEYLYVPLNVKLYPIRFDSFEMYIKAGLVGGFLMSSTLEGTTPTNFQYQKDSSASFKSNDFQGNVGLGGRGRMNNDFSIGFELAYHYGFADISDSLSTVTVPTTNNLGNDAFNTGFIGTIGLVIDI